MLKIVQVTLVLDVENESEASDAVNEILREQQKDWCPASCLLDYTLDDFAEIPLSSTGYEEGDARRFITWRTKS